METIHRWYVKHPNHFKRAPKCCMLIRQIQSQYRKYMYCCTSLSLFFPSLKLKIDFYHSFIYNFRQQCSVLYQFDLVLPKWKNFLMPSYTIKYRWTIGHIEIEKKKATKCSNSVIVVLYICRYNKMSKSMSIWQLQFNRSYKFRSFARAHINTYNFHKKIESHTVCERVKFFLFGC